MKYLIVILLIIATIVLIINRKKVQQAALKSPLGNTIIKPTVVPSNPLSIATMRQKSYPGSDITIEQTLDPGVNYNQYIASYKSDGLKIFALLTVPNGEKPKNGWPVIIFNHGYIPPEQYNPTERYIAYVDAFAQDEYIVLKSNYRGNGNSEGQPEGAYYSPAYATDVLNAISSIKKFPGADPKRIGMWGHSLGGNITLRDLVVDPKDIKAAVIWGGVVGSYNDLMNNWQRRVRYQPSPREMALRNRYQSNIVQQYGTPQTNPAFWNSIDPTFFLSDIKAPIQLHHGLSDEEVPVAFSQSLYDGLKKIGKTVELYTYEGADHNISDPSFSVAMSRSVEFFNKYLK